MNKINFTVNQKLMNPVPSLKIVLGLSFYCTTVESGPPFKGALITLPSYRSSSFYHVDEVSFCDNDDDAMIRVNSVKLTCL